MPIVDGIGLTLVQDEHGWRFESWHRDGFGTELPPDPPVDDDRRRYFETADAAGRYFKLHYGPVLIGH